MSGQKGKGLHKIPFFGDRGLFVLVAAVISIIAVATSGLSGKPVKGDPYTIVRARVLETDDSKLSAEPYIRGMRIGRQIVTLELRSGQHKGERFKVENAISRIFNIDCRPGMTILCNVRETGGVVDGVDIFGYNREGMIYGLVFVFLAILIAIGRKKGFYSAISLAFTMMLIIFFMIPRIMAGQNPISSKCKIAVS